MPGQGKGLGEDRFADSVNGLSAWRDYIVVNFFLFSGYTIHATAAQQAMKQRMLEQSTAVIDAAGGN